MKTKEIVDDQYTGIYASIKLRDLNCVIDETEFNIEVLKGSLNVYRASLAGYTSRINDDRSDSEYTLDDASVLQLKGAIFATITKIKAFEKEVVNLQEKLNELLIERAKYTVR